MVFGVFWDPPEGHFVNVHDNLRVKDPLKNTNTFGIKPL